jgi:hypothetical protein
MSNWNELLKGLNALEMQFLVEFGEEKLMELHHDIHVTRSEYPDEFHDFDEDGYMYAITFDMSLYMAMNSRLHQLTMTASKPVVHDDDLPF